FFTVGHWPACTRAIGAYLPPPAGLKIVASPSLTSNQSLPKASRMFGLCVTTRVLVPGAGAVPARVRRAWVRRLFSFGLTTRPPSLTSSVDSGSRPPASRAVEAARVGLPDRHAGGLEHLAQRLRVR